MAGRKAKKAPTLDDLRAEIDRIDRAIVTLLDGRARLAVRTASLKTKMGEGLYQPAREAVVLRRVLARRKVFPAESLVAVYREVMGASLSLEHPFTISILGPEATYTHMAALRQFGRRGRIRFESSIPDVFLRVEKSEADVGIVPVENSTEGVIVHTLDTIVDSSLLISGEVLLPVKHHLLAHPSFLRRGDARPKKIVSHPQALAQCRNYLEANFSGVPLATAASTAAAALQASKSPGVAAIASALAAETYGLEFLRRSIEDAADNTTRFLVLSRPGGAPTPRTGADKTSIAFSMKDRPGALFTMLAPFQRRGINLTKIESRPSRVKSWRYVFFLDMEGHASDPRIASALAALEAECRYYRLLGSYPRWPEV